jgi:hypothetical protein
MLIHPIAAMALFSLLYYVFSGYEWAFVTWVILVLLLVVFA